MKKITLLCLLLMASAAVIYAFARPATNYIHPSYPMARAFIHKNLERISEEFIRLSPRDHDATDASQVSIGYGFRMVTLRHDLHYVYQELPHFRYMLDYSNDWLFVLNYRGQSRGHVVARYVGGEYYMNWSESGVVDTAGHWGAGIEMSPNMFWHLDTFLEQRPDFVPREMVVSCRGNHMWLMNGARDIVQVSNQVLSGMHHIRAENTHVMDGGMVGNIIKWDIAAFWEVRCEWCIFGEMPGLHQNHNMGETYRSITNPPQPWPASPPAENDISHLVASEMLESSWPYIYFIVYNHSNYTIHSFGFPRLEFFDGDEWLWLLRLRSGFPITYISIAPGGYHKFAETLAFHYPLQQGLYRICTGFRVDFNEWQRGDGLQLDVVTEFYFTSR